VIDKNYFRGNILDKARLAISRMVAPGEKILVAVSGGADSVCLLYLLKEMQEQFPFDLSIAHMDHMARGEESAEDARFVCELGAKLGLETFIEKVDVGKEKETFKTSFGSRADSPISLFRVHFEPYSRNKAGARSHSRRSGGNFSDKSNTRQWLKGIGRNARNAGSGDPPSDRLYPRRGGSLSGTKKPGFQGGYFQCR
jgi:3'-phosphoadenosine 5'-phosphosulfate sulfotransferase (PAPS reductase)/FAD synthetase